jgi:hypothetical protein
MSSTSPQVTGSSAIILPALITGAGERAAWRFLEFFTANIRNKHTRAAYTQAAGAFLRWCERRGITRIEDEQPVHVAGYTFLNSIDVSHVVGLRDRAFVAVMISAFARLSAVIGLKVEDYFPLKKRWRLRLREKGGKVTRWAAITSSSNFWMRISRPPESATTKRGRCSAPRSAGRASCLIGQCRASMRGTWCSAVPKMRGWKQP